MFVEQARLFVDFCFSHCECGRPTSAQGWYIMLSCTRRPAEGPIISRHCMYIHRSRTLNETIIRCYHHPIPQRLSYTAIYLECRACADILRAGVSLDIEQRGRYPWAVWTYRKLPLDLSDRAVELSRDHQLLVVGQ